MKILSSWLADFVELGELTTSKNLVRLLAAAGIETASVEELDGEFVLELEITANRPDLLCHYGVAREIAALTGRALKPYDCGREIASGGAYSIAIETENCATYAGLVMKNVAVKPSPVHIQERLRKIGLRPISNVVDATNYVMMEMNHPMHAFDLDKLRGGIIVRQAKPGEKIRLLDGKEYALKDEAMVIADHVRPVALAGIMGGEETGVGTSTRNVLLEAAWFVPASIRKTGRGLGIFSDSSYRFERTADVTAPVTAIRRLASMILETAGGEISGGIVVASRETREPVRIPFRRARVARMLGCDVAHPEDIFRRIGVSVDGDSAIAPSWRPDLEREIDLIEELARLNGYANLPTTLPAFKGRSKDFIGRAAGLGRNDLVGESAERFMKFRRRSAAAMAELGFDRCVSFSFESERFSEIAVSNPINAEMSGMRRTLLPALVRIVELRENRGLDLPDMVFELDKVFKSANGVPDERYALAGIVSGVAASKRYDGRPEDIASMDHAVGAVTGLLSRLRIPVELDYSGGIVESEPFAGPHRTLFEHSCAVRTAGGVVGRVGLLHRGAVVMSDPTLKKDEPPLFGFELELDLLWERSGASLAIPRYKPLPRFPAARRDLAFWIDAEIPCGEVLSAASSAEPANLESMELVDLFQPKKERRKSACIRLVFRAESRTLTDAEITAAVDAVIESVTKKLNAELRSK